MRWWSRMSGRSTAGPRAIQLATVTWPATPLDPFFNANTMDDIAEAERLAALDEPADGALDAAVPPHRHRDRLRSDPWQGGTRAPERR